VPYWYGYAETPSTPNPRNEGFTARGTPVTEVLLTVVVTQAAVRGVLLAVIVTKGRAGFTPPPRPFLWYLNLFNHQKGKTMASHRESGMATYVGHLRQLIAVVKVFGQRYAPPNARLTVPALQQLAEAANEGLAQVSRMIPPCVVAEHLSRLIELVEAQPGYQPQDSLHRRVGFGGSASGTKRSPLRPRDGDDRHSPSGERIRQRCLRGAKP
jgi:hypothetical protein